jgi:cation transporter-like permease
MNGPRSDHWQELAQVYAVMVCLGLLLLLQTIILGVAVEGFLAGVDKVIAPALFASGLCFAAACWFTYYLKRIGTSD